MSSYGLAYLTSLEELRITCYFNKVRLEDKDDEKVSMEMNNGLGLMPWKSLQRLRRLEVPWQRHLQEGLQYLTSLEELGIDYYEGNQVEADNEEMEGRELLQKLGLMERLQSLDIEMWIRYLYFLQHLKLANCEELVSMNWGILANMNLQPLKLEWVWKVDKSSMEDDWVAEQQNLFNPLVQLRIEGDVGD